MHWSEEMMFQSKNDDLLQKTIAHQELLSGTTDVSVTVLESHSCESSLLDLEGNASSQVKVDLSFLSWVHTCVGSSSEDVETLVSDSVDHYLISIKIN